MILTSLFIHSGIPNVTGQQNPYAPEVTVDCYVYSDEIVTHPYYEDY